MATSECPSCGAMVNVGSNPRMGQRVVCKECDTELEVVWLEPIELDWLYDDDEDDDYGEDEDLDY